MRELGGEALMERPTLGGVMPSLTPGKEISITAGEPLAPGVGTSEFSGKLRTKFRPLI
jgi:hypothetical protein